MQPLRRALVTSLAGLALLACAQAGAQQKTEITITRQPGIIYLPSHVMEKQQLIEKEAQKLGIPTLKINWVNLSGGGAQTDSLLSGNVDVVNTGVGNLLLLWDRTKGGVKGIIANSALPLTLVSRNPNIKTLKDYGPNDRIAVPTLKVSTQAILLQMASAAAFGPDQLTKMDVNTVQLGHPDAAIAMSNPQSEITSHFAAPPYSYIELKSVKDAHIILSSPDIIGGPLTQSQFFTTTQFAEANPKIVQAIRAATFVAIDFIKKDTRASVDIYREITQRQDGHRRTARHAQAAGHDGLDRGTAGHDEICRAPLQGRHAEDDAQVVERLLPVHGAGPSR